MLRRVSILLLATILTPPLFASCATIFSGGPQSLTLNSEPSGATYQYGPYTGKTPATVQASRSDLAHIATFSLPGYEPSTVPVETGVQGVTWVDVLFWPGFIVDFVTGNAYKVTTPTISATLIPLTAPAPPPASTLHPPITPKADSQS